jgi:uncharacterized protein YbaR (Trm112 family)
MFIELVDALRCPHPHEESWLVLAASRLEARHVLEGTLGCPVCHAQYPIRGGVVDLRSDSGVRAVERASDARDAARLVQQVGALDLSAMLDLADVLGFAVLVGEWGRHAHALLELEQVPPILLVDPPDGVELVPGLSGVRAYEALPLAAGAARAVALDGTDPTRLASGAQVTRTGGRIVAPAGAVVPEGVRVLVRDEYVWVGEREAAPSSLVRLHVRRGL